ncbi:MAG: spore cortex-lytic enzyme [Clostridia bacterium]
MMVRPKKVRVLALMLGLMLCVAQWVQAAEVVAWGATGEKVRSVQSKIKQCGYYDGTFAQSTYLAVVAFQRKNGLAPDGVVGGSTAAAMGVTLAGNTAAVKVNASSNDEVQLLARIVHGEARGEPYTGKVAVAAVVLNRVRHASFPNTISGVIYQPGAFDAVADGQFYLSPDEDSYRAARDAMNGWDPTYGCIYYYNPSTATNGWIWSREVRLTIGKHAFAV